MPGSRWPGAAGRDPAPGKAGPRPTRGLRTALARALKDLGPGPFAVRSSGVSDSVGACRALTTGEAAHLADWQARAGAMGLDEMRPMAIPPDRRHRSKGDYPALRRRLGG